MTDSYLPGKRRNTSRMTTTASWTTCPTRVATRSSSTLTHFSDPPSTRTARAPTARTARRAKSASTSAAYSRSSSNTWSSVRGVASAARQPSFSALM
jgi:hypothetical protein